MALPRVVGEPQRILWVVGWSEWSGWVELPEYVMYCRLQWMRNVVGKV